jgi:hypothetical protein
MNEVPEFKGNVKAFATHELVDKRAEELFPNWSTEKDWKVFGRDRPYSTKDRKFHIELRPFDTSSVHGRQLAVLGVVIRSGLLDWIADYPQLDHREDPNRGFDLEVYIVSALFRNCSGGNYLDDLLRRQQRSPRRRLHRSIQVPAWWNGSGRGHERRSRQALRSGDRVVRCGGHRGLSLVPSDLSEIAEGFALLADEGRSSCQESYAECLGPGEKKRRRL